MRATYLDDPSTPVPGDVLAQEGILYRAMPTAAGAWEAPLDELRRERGYVQMDEVYLGPETPDLQALCDKFFVEHSHTDEEIRFVVAGDGIFDLRDAADRWMRVEVEPGDLVIVPAGKYHRFALAGSGTITCKRLFRDTAGWSAIPRPASAD